MSRDTTVIVCSELSLEMLGALHGNVAADCDYCGRGVVLSTEGQQFRARELELGLHDCKLTCPPCAIEREGDSVYMGGVPGAEERAQREGRVPSHVVKAMSGKTIREIFQDDP